MNYPREIRIGVIGCGGRGELANYAHQPEQGYRLVAAADVDDAALRDFRQKYGSDTFVTKDYRAVLARPDIEAVFITTPDFLHEEHTLAAIAAGKAVYLEKPMAITIEGCDRILKAARQQKVKLYLGHNMRHFPVVRKLKDLIDSGAIGQVKAGWCRHFIAYGGDAYFRDWHADRRNTTSLLLQKAAHDIDVLHWLCGSYTRRVTAMGNLTVYNQITDRRDPNDHGNLPWSHSHWPPLSLTKINPIVDVEDLSMMLMELSSGVLCSYQQCHYTPDAWRNYTIIGTEGRIENFGEVPGKNTVVRLWNHRCDHKPEGDQEFTFPDEGGSHGGGDRRIIAEFLRYLRDGGKTDTSPVAARNSVAAGCMATASLRHGSTPMDIPPLSSEILEWFE